MAFENLRSTSCFVQRIAHITAHVYHFIAEIPQRKVKKKKKSAREKSPYATTSTSTTTL